MKLSLGFNEMFTSGNTLITPIPPTIYEYHMLNPRSKGISSDYKMMICKLISPLDNDIVKSQFNKENDIESKYRIQCFKMLTQVMRSNFLNSNNVKHDKLMIRIRAVLDNLFPILYVRTRENIQYVECASEVIHECIERNKIKPVVRDLQKDIMDVFDMGPFFRCSASTLKYWAKIIDTAVTLSKTDLLEEYLK